jgi:D-arabinan exo alpha-(1,3)/(1,5)-arabinofuranosidase (non-reducing end)
MGKLLDCNAFLLLMAWLTLSSVSAIAQTLPFGDIASIKPGATKAENSLWLENPVSEQFKSSRHIVIAQIKGPAEITMMHFAYARDQLGKDAKKPLREQVGNGERLNRDLVLRIYWDGQPSPAVECPLVDFFCDPDDVTDAVATAFVNVCRGFNAYFPMPFRKSAKVELDYEGPLPPGDDLQRMMPCYSYVCYHQFKRFPRDAGYFHASWRQQALLLGREEYVALDAVGKGKCIGWNVTVHSLYHDSYPVDENEKFCIDGETNASIEFQGLEDSFGFSWGFPPKPNFYPLTGYFNYLNGAAAYRFFVSDAIHFDRSLKILIGFGATENGWRRNFSKPETAVQFSSTIYWYQTSPSASLSVMPPPGEREPAPMRPFPKNSAQK